jgi:hypothetical protein
MEKVYQYYWFNLYKYVSQTKPFQSSAHFGTNHPWRSASEDRSTADFSCLCNSPACLCFSSFRRRSSSWTLWNAVKRMANGESFNWHFLILSGSTLGCLESKIVSTVELIDVSGILAHLVLNKVVECIFIIFFIELDKHRLTSEPVAKMPQLQPLFVSS